MIEHPIRESAAANFLSEALAAAERSGTPVIPHPRPIVVIGCGSIVRDAHLPAYRKAGFPVAALVDSNLSKASGLAHSFGVESVATSLDQLKSGVDCIFDVAVPAPAILDVLPLLPHGSPVLIQKPMGETLDEAKAIVEICRGKGLIAAINFQLRWAPVMMAAKQIADAGLLGELHDLLIEVTVHTPWDMWTFLSAAPRLEILYHSIHYIDLVRSWLGNPRSVYAKTVRNPRTPKLAATKTAIVLDYGDWKRVRISTNHSHDFSPQSQHSFMQWEGTQAAMRAVMGVNLNYPKGEPDSLSYVERDGSWTRIPTRGDWFPDAFVGSMASLQAFVAGVSQELPTRVEDALDTMRVVEAAYISSDLGGVTLP